MVGPREQVGDTGTMRRHRIHEDEVPAVRWGLHRYLSSACNGSIEEDQDVIYGFKLFYRVVNCRIGQPDYPNILDEDGRIDYGSIADFLVWAEAVYPELRTMDPLVELVEMEVIESG